MAQICKSCGETYGDDAALCSIDGQPLEPWTAGFARAMARTLTAESGAGSRTGAATQTGALPLSQPLAPPPDLAAGRILSGRYLLEAQIGVGGFGVVFRARDQRLGKRVAVKVLSPRLARWPDMLARFHQEAVAASQI